MRLALLGLLIVAFSCPAMAAVITTTSGDVKILSPLLTRFKKKLKYQGKLYSYRRARVGQKIKKGQSLLTGPGSRARVVYADGSHFNLGEASFLKVGRAGKAGAKAKAKTVDLLYGKLRAVVKKYGNSNRPTFKVKTPLAVAGVRGTDLYVRQRFKRDVQVSVLNGEVEVTKPKTQEKVIVTQGKTAVTAPSFSKIKKVTTTRRVIEKVIKISKEIKLAQEQQKDEIPQEALEVEQKANQVLVAEIKSSKPELYTENREVASSSLEESYLQTLEEEAPDPPEGADPLSNYQKYFND